MRCAREIFKLLFSIIFMKILAIGDFHGRFPEKLKKEAEKADLILSPGDFANADKIRKLIFKNWVDRNWYEAVGLKKAKALEKESFISGLKVLKETNKLGRKFYFVWGNSDFYKDSLEKDDLSPGYYNDKIKKMKNLISADKRKKKFHGLEIVGFGGYVDVTEYVKRNIDENQKKHKKRLKRYNQTKGKLFDIFESKPDKNFIFLIHYSPYGVFDKVKFKGSPMNGKHVGFEPYNWIIEKYKPMLVISGHMHEYQGAKRMGKSLLVNPGPALEGKAAVIDVDEINKKVKSVRFIK